MKLIELLRQITGNDSLVLYENDAYVDQWLEWYTGKVKKFHSYKVYNGRREVAFERFSLGMAKKVCEDWANLLVNEKTDITLGDEASQNVLNEVLRNCSFWRKANEGVEKTFALGQGAWVVSVKNIEVDPSGGIKKNDVAKVDVSFVNAKNIKPITYEDDRVTECAFISRDSRYTYIAVHLRGADGTYDVHNFVAEGDNLDSLNVFAERAFVFHTHDTEPWFYVLKPNIANNININSPFGISIFANAIDTLKEIDIVYDSYQNEFVLGKKRVFVSVDSSYIELSSGEQRETFDSNDVAFYVLPHDETSNPFISDNTQTLRVADHQLALQDQLNLLSYACGFGTEHYKFNAGGVATATQIISENSDMFRNIKKHEILIEDALVTIVRAIIYAVNTFTMQRINAGTNIEVKFDDSIIEDKQAEKTSDRLDVSMGVMSKAEYRAKWYNEDIDTAQAKIDEMSSMTISDPGEEPPFENDEG